MKPKIIFSTSSKKIFSLFLTIFITSQIFSQQVQKPTTELDYNYVTSGYKRDFDNGRPIQQGYTLTTVLKITIDERTVKVNSLYRTGESNPCALMIIYSKEGQETQYFCAPTYDTNLALWDRFYNSLDDGNGLQTNKYHVILYALAKAQMKMFQPAN